MRYARFLALIVALAAGSYIGRAQQPAAAKSAGGPFDTLHFRPIGPASMSGRIADVAVYESNPSIFYVVPRTAASGKPPTLGRRLNRSSRTSA